MDLEAAKKLVESRVVQKYIDTIDSDADTAESEMKSILGQMSDYPAKYVSEYKKDAKALDDARGEFNAEWNKIVFKKAKDGKAAMAAYRDYVLKLGVLEEQNIRFGAYIEADAAKMMATFISFLIALLERIRKAAEQLRLQLEELQKLLERAKSEVTEAKVQRILNIGISVVSLCLPTVGLAAGIGIAVGTFTVQYGLDYALGPGKPALPGMANSAAGDVVGLKGLMKPRSAKFAGAASMIISFKLDSDEVEEAEKIVKAVQESVAAAAASLKRFESMLDNDSAKLEQLRKGLEGALKAAAAAAEKYKSAESRRLGLLKELATLK